MNCLPGETILYIQPPFQTPTTNIFTILSASVYGFSFKSLPLCRVRCGVSQDSGREDFLHFLRSHRLLLRDPLLQLVSGAHHHPPRLPHEVSVASRHTGRQRDKRLEHINNKASHIKQKLSTLKRKFSSLLWLDNQVTQYKVLPFIMSIQWTKLTLQKNLEFVLYYFCENMSTVWMTKIHLKSAHLQYFCRFLLTFISNISPEVWKRLFIL